jgi:hypothetical protein
MRTLVHANVLLLLLVLLHDADHIRVAGDDVPAPLWLLNPLTYVPTIVSLVLARRGDRLAPAATAISAALWVVGFAWVHLLGAGSFWGPFAEPYTESDPGALTWIAFFLPMLGAALAIAAAIRATSGRSGVPVREG